MKCPKCDEKTEVIDSRPHIKSNSIKRLRRCLSCGYRFKTYEIVSDYNPNIVLRNLSDVIEKSSKVFKK